MTSANRNEDHHFSSFAMGVSIGVVAALLFGTEEGRKIVKEILDAIPEKYKQIPEKHLPLTPIITPEETPHHTTFRGTEVLSPDATSGEAPPPLPPSVNPHHPQ